MVNGGQINWKEQKAMKVSKSVSVKNLSSTVPDTVRMTRFIWKTYIILKSVSNFLFKAKHNVQEANNSACNLEQ